MQRTPATSMQDRAREATNSIPWGTTPSLTVCRNLHPPRAGHEYGVGAQPRNAGQGVPRYQRRAPQPSLGVGQGSRAEAMYGEPGDLWDSLWSEFEALRAAVGQSKAQNVNAKGLRDSAKALVQSY